jgi:selT/selW/selH-like putative selenoprotein
MVSEVLSEIQHDVSKVTLIPGDNGAFEWTVNGDLVYSKHATGRYPELDEIKEAVYALVS